MDILKNRYLAIHSTKHYTQISPEEVITLWTQLKAFLGASDSSMTEIEYMSMTHMLFDLSIYVSKDVEAETIYNTFRDRFGANSPYLFVMRASLMQVNEGDRKAEDYLTKLLSEYLELETDIVGYPLVSKKLLAVQRKSLPREKYMAKLLDLTEKFPVDAEIWYALALEYATLGQLEEAAYCLEEVLCISPFNYIVFAHLSELLYYRASKDSKNREALLQQSLNNALRSVELSETFVKGWAFAGMTSKLLSKSKLLTLSKVKLEEITRRGNETDKATAKKILVHL
ncbi:LANO_0G07030g1_1 [Lachancea nothofagi CBS 11611]|uniref:ER membrane protein complex subunit 2 n=1 Tax=Lachancea nothofagi CBS 11611 TaxID=1266666 RepID=A0A1G4KHE6_9SACH|nr:LANO_0G07030g1_1 [Lachancea nothofagi CBS 11611]